jgi:hypothetical protein
VLTQRNTFIIFRRTSIGLLFVFVTATYGFHSSAETGYEWQDASRNTTVLVNVNQYIWEYMHSHPDWFSLDKTITDFVIQDVAVTGRARAAEQYTRIRSYLEQRNLSVGTYMSGTTVGPDAEQTRYPATNISIEKMPTDARYVSRWPGDPNRRIIDVADPGTRHALQDQIRMAWASIPAPIRFVDNAAIHSSAGKGQAWVEYCRNMRELRDIAEGFGSRAIFNISAHIGYLTSEELQQLITAIGHHGIALEMPMPATTDKVTISRAEMQYRKLLDAGMGVIMIPVNIDEESVTRWTLDWRRAEDHLYTAHLFWQPPSALQAKKESRQATK